MFLGNNLHVLKTLDYIALSIILAIVVFVWGALILDSLPLAIILACALSLAITFSVRFFGENKYKYSPQLLATHFTIQGNEYVTNLIAGTISGVETKANYIYLPTCLIASLFKFATTTSQDVATVSKEALSHGVTKVFVLGCGIDRKAYQVANYLGVRLKLVKAGAIYRYLAKHDALPDLKKKKSRPSLKVWFDAVFARANVKYYAFSGVVLVLTSFITPLKFYYLIAGSVSLLLAIFSLAFGDGSVYSLNAFKELENAVHKDCAQNNDENMGED